MSDWGQDLYTPDDLASQNGRWTRPGTKRVAASVAAILVVAGGVTAIALLPGKGPGTDAAGNLTAATAPTLAPVTVVSSALVTIVSTTEHTTISRATTTATKTARATATHTVTATPKPTPTKKKPPTTTQTPPAEPTPDPEPVIAPQADPTPDPVVVQEPPAPVNTPDPTPVAPPVVNNPPSPDPQPPADAGGPTYWQLTGVSGNGGQGVIQASASVDTDGGPVTVTFIAEGPGGTHTVQLVSGASAGGSWSKSLKVPPGSYQCRIEATVGDHFLSGGPWTAKVI
ncbi:hypothetical protein D1871_04615 [Nakamurella silvestris]|nr:hypothetical protein D1871_04615 [Nakamurella silvestris]